MTTTTIHLSCDQIERYCNEAFIRFGFTEDEAKIITDVLLLADLYGIKSHGTQRLVRYHKSIKNGSVKVDAKPEIIFETPVSAVVDGHAGMGQLVAYFSMELAIKKARDVGMAFVTVRNSNHYGIAGYYTKMACDRGLIAISTTNTESIAVHTGSKQALLGSNPIAFAMPAHPYPFWFDAATTVVPRGKLEVYNKADKLLASGWAIGEDGGISESASHVLHCINDKVGTGGILPVGGNTEDMGGHKGYGFSMIAELLSAITSGGATSNHHIRQAGVGAGSCHAFIVIDPRIFGEPEKQKQHLSVFLQELRDAKRVNDNVPIYTHGEKEWNNLERIKSEGIEIDIHTFGEMIDICDDLGMDRKTYFGNVDTSVVNK